MNNVTLRTLCGALGVSGAVLLGGGGCVATTGAVATREANLRADYDLVNEKIRRIEGDAESMRRQLEYLGEELRRIQTRSAAAAETQSASLQAALAALEARIQRLETQRETDRREIIETLSRRVADLVNAQAAAAAPRSGGAGPGGYAYEHIVTGGETLSRIAQAYGTTVSAILKANNLPNADTLRVGQKLLIPE